MLLHPKLDEILLPEDRCSLLNILPVDLPLELTVSKIEDNIYWKKCSLNKWPTQMPRNVINKRMFAFPTRSDKNESLDATSLGSEDDLVYIAEKSWKQYYLENYIKEFLEKLQPEQYDPEKLISSNPWIYR
ncbi:hypothetical protein HHI36_004288 [Cryptolaemus montrouzieri]|uniref:Uncharacterized protein n=1 Tax=Cryptolaemus montrouzieri TaxID=559131 RepID=A0ABD2NRF0_9CUCU